MNLRPDDILQLWSYATQVAESAILELIEEMSAQYEDPEAAEVSFISVWQHIVRG